MREFSTCRSRTTSKSLGMKHVWKNRGKRSNKEKQNGENTRKTNTPCTLSAATAENPFIFMHSSSCPSCCTGPRRTTPQFGPSYVRVTPTSYRYYHRNDNDKNKRICCVTARTYTYIGDSFCSTGSCPTCIRCDWCDQPERSSIKPKITIDDY